MKKFLLVGLCFCQLLVTGVSVSKEDGDIDFSIPENYGSIKERFSAENNLSPVIFIQDIHTSASAQKHLADIILYLYKTHGISNIGIEGATGKIDTSELSIFPDKTVKKYVGEYFYRKGKIDGAEYLSIVENNGHGNDIFKLFGIENTDLYKQNLNAYTCSLPYKDLLTGFADSLRKNANSIKPHVYSKSLMELDNTIQLFHTNKQDFISYCQNIVEFANHHDVKYEDLSNLIKILKTANLEKNIDFNRTDSERSYVVLDLSSQIPEKESSALLRKELLFKSQQIPVKQYLTYLDDLFMQYDYDISSYINLKKFIRYADLYSKINKTTLLKETTTLERNIYAKLITTAQQQTLYDISRYASLISKFANLQMSRGYFDQYKRLADGMSLSLIEKFIKNKNNRYGLNHSLNVDITTVELVLKNFEDFYKTAQMREQDMVTNLLKLLKNSADKPVILVAGGYHCKGITETLRTKNISYVVITPSTAKDNSSIPYLTLLNNFKTPLEELIAANTSTLKLASWLAINPLTQENLRPILLTKMKTLFTTTKLHLLYKKALSEQPDLKGDIAFRENIQDNLKKAINDVISLANYHDVLQIDSIEISNSGLSAQITFLQNNQPVDTIAVVFTETPDASSRLNDETRDNLLELVNLSTGLNEEFLDYAGYSSIRVKSTSTKILILKNLAITDQADLALLTRDVNLANGNAVKSEQVLGSINDLIQDGIVAIEKDGDRTLYSIRKDESSQDILDILTHNNYSSTLETGTIVIKTDNLPSRFRDKYPNFCNKVSLITADATIGFIPLFETMSQILSQESDLVEDPNNMSIPSSQIGVDCIKNLGTDLFSLHIQKISRYENNADWLPDDSTVSTKNLSLRNNVKINDYTRHSIEETDLDLFMLAQLGHNPSMEKLINKYNSLAKKLASKTFYYFRTSGFAQQGLDIQDFITSGQMGLAEAIKGFDPSKGFTFTTFAWKVISNRVSKEMNANATVKVHIRKNIAIVLYGISAFKEKYGEKPTNKELAKFLNNGFTVDIIKRALEAYKSNPVSLNKPLLNDRTNDRDASTLQDFIEDKNPDSYSDKTAIKNDNKEKLNIALAYLTDQERDILQYHIMEEAGVLDDLAEKYNLSRERIRQIEAEALRKIKPILELLMYSKSNVVERISIQLKSLIGQLSPQEHEIIMLSISESMPNKTIAEVLNFDSVPKLAQHRINIIHKLRKEMLVRFQSDETITDTILDKKIKFEMFIRIAIKRKYDMVDILTDFAKEELDSSIPIEDLRSILENYEDFLTPYEQELILLRYHRRLNTKEVGEITSISKDKTIFKYLLIQKKLQSIISLNYNISNKTTLLFKGFLLDSINDMSLEKRNAFLNLFYDNLPLKEIETKYNIVTQTVYNIKANIISSLRESLDRKNRQLDIDEIPYKDYKYLSKNLEEEHFEPFLMGLIYNIKRDEFSETDKIEPKYQLNFLLSFLTPKEQDIINQNIASVKNLIPSSAINELDETDTYKPDDYKTSEDQLNDLETKYDIDTDQIGRLQESITEKLKPIASFLSNVNRSDLTISKRRINDKFKNLPPQEQEILILTYVQSKSDKDIIARLNFDSEASLYKRRQKILKKLKNQLRHNMPESLITDFLSAEETDLGMVLNAFLEFYQEDMIDILTFFAVKKLRTTIPYDRLLIYFKDYEDFITPYEQELITLFNNRHLTATQAGKITNQHMNGVSQNYTLVQKKVQTVLSFRDKFNQHSIDIFTKPLLKGINKMDLIKRNIFLDTFYNSLTSNQIAAKYGKHRSWVYQIKVETLEILRQSLLNEYEIAKKDIASEDLKVIKEQLQEDNFESFLQGLIYNIKKDQFSQKEHGPENISEALMKLTKTKINPKIDQPDLNTLIEDATFFVQPFFITQLNYDIFSRHHIGGINQVQVAREFDLPVNKVRNIIRYRTEALKDFLSIYENLTPKEIEDVRLLIADSIMGMEYRRKQTLVYFAYDGLNYVEIEKARGAETTDRSAQIKFQRTFTDLQKRLLSKLTSDKIKMIFEGNLIHLKYFIRGMNRSIPRNHFNIPKLILTEETEEQETDIEDIYKYELKYDKLFLETLISRLDHFKDQSDIETNLSTALDTLTEKQLFLLDLSLKNQLTKKNVLKKYNMKLGKAKEQLEVAMTQLKGFIDFYNLFSKQDLSFLRNELTDIITELPIPYKFSLILHYYDNLTLKQMAEASGVKDESNYNIVRATNMLEKQFLEKLESNTLKNSFVSQRENLRYLLYSLKAEISREKFGVQTIEKDKLSQPDSAEDLYTYLDTDERISVYVSLLQAINELSIDDKIIVIAYFYDRLKKAEIQYLFKLDTSNKNFERTLRKIQSGFIDKLTSPRLKNFFTNDIKSSIYFFDKMSDEIPRSLLDIPIRNSKQNSPETIFDDQNKDTDDEKETSSTLIIYTQKDVNRLYFNLTTDSEKHVTEFKQYLAKTYNNPEIPLPDPIVLANIPPFANMHKLSKKTDLKNETLDYFIKITNLIGLDFSEKATLLNILIQSRFLNLDISQKDQIILDFDTFGFHLNASSNNIKIRKLLIEHIKMLQQVYDKKGRRFNITVVSKKLTTRQMETLLSPHLFGSLWQNNILWGNDKLQSFGEPSDQETYAKLMFHTLQTSNLNPVNLKVFSDNPNFLESALSIGAVCANRHGSVFDAFKTFANIHPDKSANLATLKNHTDILTLSKNNLQGYFALSGHEFCLPVSKESKQNIRNKNLIDQSM